MTYEMIYKELRKMNIPLSEIKELFDYHFNFDFNRLFLDGYKESKIDPAPVFEKLKMHYPVPYITGQVTLDNARIFLDESTLIPRLETIQFLHYIYITWDLNQKSVLDLATGSGVIALLLKKHYPKAKILATDIQESCLEQVKKSADYNGLEVEIRESNYFSNVEEKFDFIISNPPYIDPKREGVYAPYEPEIALYTEGGTLSYRTIFSELDRHLNPSGIACFECDSAMCGEIELIFKEMHGKKYSTEIWIDDYKRERYLIVKKLTCFQ